MLGEMVSRIKQLVAVISALKHPLMDCTAALPNIVSDFSTGTPDRVPLPVWRSNNILASLKPSTPIAMNNTKPHCVHSNNCPGKVKRFAYPNGLRNASSLDPGLILTRLRNRPEPFGQHEEWWIPGRVLIPIKYVNTDLVDRMLFVIVVISSHAPMYVFVGWVSQGGKLKKYFLHDLEMNKISFWRKITNRYEIDAFTVQKRWVSCQNRRNMVSKWYGSCEMRFNYQRDI